MAKFPRSLCPKGRFSKREKGVGCLPISGLPLKIIILCTTVMLLPYDLDVTGSNSESSLSTCGG